jgi:hypothetical protein
MQTVDDVANEVFSSGVQQLDFSEEATFLISDDMPFLQLAGIFETGVPDLGLNHDKYLAEAYAETDDQEQRYLC